MADPMADAESVGVIMMCRHYMPWQQILPPSIKVRILINRDNEICSLSLSTDSFCEAVETSRIVTNHE